MKLVYHLIVLCNEQMCTCLFVSFRSESIAVFSPDEDLNIFLLFFSSQHLIVDGSSPKRIFLFREASKVICALVGIH